MSFLIRLEGGALDGMTFVNEGPWPLPDELGSEQLLTGDAPFTLDGSYVKVSESQLSGDHPNLARGALYRWKDP